MTNHSKVVPPSVPIAEYYARKMQDPNFRREYEALGPEFEIVEQIIARRIEQGLTQTALAKKVGAPQSSIARLESRQNTRNLDFVRRVAEALDCTLEVRLVPKRNGTKVAVSKTADTSAQRRAGAEPRRAAKKAASNGAASGARRKRDNRRNMLRPDESE
jgi:transcriptional regulator with XRE-family HTH domain